MPSKNKMGILFHGLNCVEQKKSDMIYNLYSLLGVSEGVRLEHQCLCLYISDIQLFSVE